MNAPDGLREHLTGVIHDVAAEMNSAARARKLPPETMLRLLLGMEGGSIDKELAEAGAEVSASAFCQRRAQIPEGAFQEVFNRFNRSCLDAKTYQGHHLLAVDGSSINMPRNPDAPSFICHSGAPDGYNQLHLNTLYDVLNRTFYDAVIQPEPQKDEIGALVEMLQRNTFDRPTIIIADRGYESYNVIAHLLDKPNTHFVLRIKQNHSAMREVARFPMCELDCGIKFCITTTQTNEDKRNRYIFLQIPKKSKEGSKTRRARWDFPSPYLLKFRIVRFQLDTGGFETIATSLPPSFTSEDIKYLYHLRWGIETSFRDLKYSLGLVNLHGKRDEFVRQEIFSALTIFNLTSRVVQTVVARQPKDGIWAYQVNFKMAVWLCRKFFREQNISGGALQKQLARYTVPIRPGRADQRNLRAKGFIGFIYRVYA